MRKEKRKLKNRLEGTQMNNQRNTVDIISREKGDDQEDKFCNQMEVKRVIFRNLKERIDMKIYQSPS